YCGTRIHRIIDGFLIQGGDITKGDGTGSMSIFMDGTEAFGEDGFGLENIGWRSIIATTNKYRFFITLLVVNFLTLYHIVLSHIIDGIELP
ncbi:hypothetical protein L873DRAFT_1723793, partial [Choiromyces venosus 120613-1]